MKPLTLTLALIAGMVATPLHAAPKDTPVPTQIPIVGTASNSGAAAGTFTGVFTLQRFASDGNQVVAIGTVAGAVTDAAGQVTATGLSTVALPVAVNQQTNGAAAPSGAAAAPASVTAAAAAACQVLHLDLGPLNLDLLGLQVQLSRVVLDINAVPGAGNLLGNLLCSVTNLLNNPSGLAQLLNQILGILQGL